VLKRTDFTTVIDAVFCRNACVIYRRETRLNRRQWRF